MLAGSRALIVAQPVTRRSHKLLRSVPPDANAKEHNKFRKLGMVNLDMLRVLRMSTALVKAPVSIGAFAFCG